MRVVLDTNVVISGVLWQGPARRLLDAARDGIVEIFTSPELLAELEDVLHRAKFTRRLREADVSVKGVVRGFASVAAVIEPPFIDPVVTRDPDDDAVLACALASESDFIASGDRDLLDIGDWLGIKIVTPKILLEELHLE